MRLMDALPVGTGEIVALVGGGGKSTALALLGLEMAANGWRRILLTTTTQFYQPQGLADTAELVLSHDLEEALTGLREVYQRKPVAILASCINVQGKLQGIPPVWIAALKEALDLEAIVIEADGAAGKPFKAPRSYEPVIPPGTTLLVPVCGLDILGKPLHEDYVHRVEQVMALTGLKPGEIIQAEHVARVLANKAGLLKGRPETARVTALLNKVDQDPGLTGGRILGRQMLQLGLPRVVLAQLQVVPPVSQVLSMGRVTAVILAAGEGRRMGFPKQLLQVGSKTMLEMTVERALGSWVDEVIVVLGHQEMEVRRYLKSRFGNELELGKLKLASNSDYRQGQSTSLRVGIRAATLPVEAWIFLLGDQPLVGPELINSLIAAYWRSHAPLVYPRHQGRRGNPVLFATSLVPEILGLEGDRGARRVVYRHLHHGLAVEAGIEAILDVDTWDDFNALCRLLKRERRIP